MEPQTEFELRRGQVVVGKLTSSTSDFPWLFCKFEPCDSFEELRTLFADELRLLNADDMVAWEAAYEKIRALNLRLVDVKEDNEIGEFLLHIDVDEAWFRY